MRTKKDKHKTKVVFRKFPEGDIIALMVDDSWQDDNGRTLITSYQHLGQHSGASPELVNDLVPVKAKEYTKLKKELESLGYNLKVSNI